MARFTNGWVKVYRSIGEGDLVDNPILLALWVRLLTLATWKPSKILWAGKQRELPPGTVVFGLREFAESWECSRSVIHKWLRYLHDTGRIVHTASSRGTIVSICNWESYQSRESDELLEREHGEYTASTPRVHGENLIEEGKKVRKNTARTGVRAEYSEAFEGAWEAFCKVGKKADASKAFEELNLSPEEFQNLLVAIRNYLADCRAQERTSMYFGTFLREDWRIWAERPTAILKPKTLDEVMNGQ